MAKHSLYQQKDFQVASFGGFGVKIFSGSGSATSTDVFHVIEAKTDFTFSATNSAGGDSPSSYTLEAGSRIYGLFTSLTYTAGDARCYLIEQA